MASDEIYEACLAILQDDTIDEDDKTDKLETLVKSETDLTGKAADNAVLDILWRFRNASSGGLPSIRHPAVRRQSPAPWGSSRSATPAASSPRSSTASPAPPPGLGVRPALMRIRSSQQSPFTSPRASPRLPYATTYNPRSPSFESRQMSQGGHKPSITDPYGDYGSDSGDWPGSEDANYTPAALYGSSADPSTTSAWIQSQTIDMSPYDMLRSIFRDQKSDDEIESILEANGYDLSAAIASLMGSDSAQVPVLTDGAVSEQQDKTFLVGKSMDALSRPTTPAGQAKSPVVCRYWLSTGQCLRADCRFSHDLTSHVCKYWLAGNCLAGESCVFSHDPSSLMSGMSLNDSGYGGLDATIPSFEIQDLQAFPSLQAAPSEPSLRPAFGSQSSFSSRPALAPEFIPSSQRPSSSAAMSSPGLVTDDGEAFPTLGSAALRGHKKHHGKRGHGHGNKERETTTSSLADVVRMSPAPSSITNSPRTPRSTKGKTGSGKENSVAVSSIPAPEHIPWLETGSGANEAYMKARAEAIRHGGARNKFLQSAAQAWNRNDVRAAKALSLRGQSENDLMRDAHREAARHLYEERNKQPAPSGEVYVDLHGLHPAEAVSYLSTALANQRTVSALHRQESSSAYLYAIVGTGHHSKGGRDKVGKAVRGFLSDSRYAYKEFSVPGDRGGSGGILGIDARSGGSAGGSGGSVDDDTAEVGSGTGSPRLQHGKIRILKADNRRGAGSSGGGGGGT